MKKYIIIIIFILLGLVWYLNNPIVRLNSLYNLDLSLFHTEKIIWKEEWNSNGDGSVTSLLKIDEKDSKSLLQRCQESSSPFNTHNIISKYTYLCTIEYRSENEDIVSLILVKDKREKYLFYQLILQ